ncbi:MAG TPA: M13 family metallopeptidase, partial [Rhodanobacteraceae bacterium]|nr:M13 family metallopeptidase [Rhodanobacteraceae bacterium]
LSGQPAARAAIAAGDVLDLESELAEASTPRRTLARDIGARFRPVGVEEADRESPSFSWAAFFAALGVARPERFSLAMPAFHARVAELLQTTTPSVWRAYLRFHTVDGAAPYLGGAYARQHHRFHDAVLRGRLAPLPRWKRVLRAIDTHAGEAMGELYVAANFPADAKRRIVDLVEHLRRALAVRLERLDWMSDATREHALRKLAALGVKVGYPDRWRDSSGLVTSPASLYANILAARAFDRRRRVAQLGQPVDRALWPIPPQTVNAGYDPQRNEIVFPAAILAPPFFDAAADAALNYGGIGAVIAHEMTHGFDDQGSRFDADGRFRSWWLAEDRLRFEALAERLVERFDGSDVDGRLTLGENIADVGGLAIAFDALRDAIAGRDDPMIDGCSQTQRFFLNWAVIWRQNLTPEEARLRRSTDVHAPARIRANAAPAELGGYAEAFDCRSGDAMARSADARIRIW